MLLANAMTAKMCSKVLDKSCTFIWKSELYSFYILYAVIKVRRINFLPKILDFAFFDGQKSKSRVWSILEY